MKIHLAKKVKKMEERDDKCWIHDKCSQIIYYFISILIENLAISLLPRLGPIIDDRACINIFNDESTFEKNSYHPKHLKGGPTRFGVYLLELFTLLGVLFCNFLFLRCLIL